MSLFQSIRSYCERFFPLLYSCLCVFIYFKEFARRALGKIEKLAKWEQENDVPVSRETQNAFREASVKAGDTFLIRLVILLPI